MKLESVRTDEVLFAQIIQVLSVVSIIHFHQEFVLLFKEEIDFYFLNKHRVQAVIYHFSLSNFRLQQVFSFKKP